MIGNRIRRLMSTTDSIHLHLSERKQPCIFLLISLFLLGHSVVSTDILSSWVGCVSIGIDVNAYILYKISSQLATYPVIITSLLPPSDNTYPDLKTYPVNLDEIVELILPFLGAYCLNWLGPLIQPTTFTLMLTATMCPYSYWV